MRATVCLVILSLILGCSQPAEQSKESTGEPKKEQQNMQELSVAEIHSRFENQTLTAAALTHFYLDQIEQHQALGAVIMVNPAANQTAQTLDIAWQKGERRGPLHGIPVLLKDNIDTSDEMPNTAGSLIFAENFPGRDATLVTQLRNAGAIILGKANLSEWANFRSNHSISGWSGIGGQTRNPYDPSRSPCGSSAGSAVAVAANLTALAVGTETDGSVICPAALNGIVGIKPTHGTVSGTGIIPLAPSQDTAGPMARTMTDAVIMLEALRTDHKPFSQHLNANGLKEKTLGVVTNLMGYHPATDLVFQHAVTDLTTAGANITACKLPNLRAISSHEYEVLLYEFKANIAEYLADTKLPYRTLSDLITANEQNAETELHFFGQDVFEAADAKGDLDDDAYKVALASSKRLAGPEGIDAALAACGADILIAPSTSPAWKIDTIMGDHFAGGASMAAAVSGYPHITLPMGFVAGMPVGLSLFSTRDSEAVLIEAAYAYEQATQHRKPPKL
ncbi:MAG: Asp-tRNA(Asn)/Glu-tRNA(Gln) amidotransferase A subunit family amidase [Candidatus Azotimanducaceae bacterium]|jgi:Asp-tRNA(Asn)/Glu-tRNA(Gln) amidotransferase A subunit family amidase